MQGIVANNLSNAWFLLTIVFPVMHANKVIRKLKLQYNVVNHLWFLIVLNLFHKVVFSVPSACQDILLIQWSNSVAQYKIVNHLIHAKFVNNVHMGLF